MRTPTTRGTCERCGTSGTRGVLRKHLAACSAPVPEDSRRGRRRPAAAPGLLIEVVGRPRAYWLFLGVAHDAKLSDLDAWLRATWLECCDHLSEFVIGPTRYSSVPSPTFSLKARAQSMHIGVGKALRPDVAFQHHYDFGSTTVVDLSVVGELIIPVASQAIVLLASNEAPDILCSQCAEPAVSLCPDCDEDEGRCFLCVTCSALHPCGEEMLRPVVNSPRMGMCGYSGPGAP